MDCLERAYTTASVQISAISIPNWRGIPAGKNSKTGRGSGKESLGSPDPRRRPGEQAKEAKFGQTDASRARPKTDYPGRTFTSWLCQAFPGTQCRERAGDSSVLTLDEGCERGDPPITGRLPRTSGPRNLRYLHPTAMQMLRKEPQ